jgi:hypothetical protein
LFLIPAVRSCLRATLLAGLALLLSASAVLGQDGDVPSELFAGDSIRIDGSLVGRVLSIDGPNLVVVSRGIPTCRAGVMHGDAPICDPAPLIRREMMLESVNIERRTQKGHINIRTIIGGLIGAAAFGAAGYYIGPSFGFGAIDGCVRSPDTSSECDPADAIPADEYTQLQLEADQRRGVLFFGTIGGSFTAILARKLSVGWVHVEPRVPMTRNDPWGVSITIPGVR